MDHRDQPGLPAGAPDYSSYLLNVANSGADVLINVNWGHDAVLSIQQAQRFGIFDKMKLAVPVPDPVPGTRSRRRSCSPGVYAATDFWWTLEDKYPLAKLFVQSFEKRWGYKPEWGANNAYMSFAFWADAVENAGSFYPPDVIKSFEAGRKLQSTVGEVFFRKETTSSCARSSSCRARSPTR
jgi:ABC-type branched-subunit amino acid transport system substrate-binding protein